ncbi:MAG: glutaminyl-peptide cyclotransferase [Bacteroidales bacterium]|nr:glutaminyl-peptide cyclotransferase [Bacteroidales bacterium]
MHRLLIILICAVLPLSCAGANGAGTDGVRKYKVNVVKEYPHDRSSYTQGLYFLGGQMYESTGQYGESTFRKVDLNTGKALRKLDFDKRYFVEGSCVLDGKLFILTWQERIAFVYDAATLKYLKSYSYPREGWGLTTDGKQLIASDGSSNLFFMDADFKVTKTVTVKLNGRPVRLLNELEYIDGKVWANVYLTDMIVIIDPESGAVEATVDCTGLLPDRLRRMDTDVLNGIAKDDKTGKIYITGKNWPRLYEISLQSKQTK